MLAEDGTVAPWVLAARVCVRDRLEEERHGRV
jgi:hypothetical protein